MAREFDQTKLLMERFGENIFVDLLTSLSRADETEYHLLIRLDENTVMEVGLFPNLRRPGIGYLLTEPDDTALNRFGTPLNWIRARLKSDGPPGEPTVAGVYPNTAWASERRTWWTASLASLTTWKGSKAISATRH